MWQGKLIPMHKSRQLSYVYNYIIKISGPQRTLVIPLQPDNLNKGPSDKCHSSTLPSERTWDTTQKAHSLGEDDVL